MAGIVDELLFFGDVSTAGMTIAQTFRAGVRSRALYPQLC